MSMLRSAGRAVLAFLLFTVTVTFSPAIASAAPVACGGVVFQDYDADGERNENYSAVNDSQGSSTTAFSSELDPGVAGVTVTVTTSTGVVQVDTTDANGEWSVTVDDGQFPVRAQFSTLPSGWQSAPSGTDSGTTTQFIDSPADCANPFDGDGPSGNLGVVAPGSFCESNPNLVTSCFLFGNVVDHDNQAAIVRLADGTQDNNAETDWATPAYEVSATLGQVGTVWGQGVNPRNGDVYLGSMVKRHTRLAGNPTTIYKLTESGTVSSWFTSAPTATDPHTAEADATALGLSDPLDGWMYDFGAFDDVGKAGLGDVEVSPDGSMVYTVDLGRRELVSIAIDADGSAGAVTRTALTAATLGLGGSCAATDIRPFGLGFNSAGLLHIGVVCSAESTVPASFSPITSAGPALGTPASLGAWVHSFDGSFFSQVTTVPVPTTSRGSSVGGGTAFSHLAEWRPWVDKMPYASADLPSYGNTYPQPMVSDIDFDGDDIIVSIMDRWGHQTGANAFYEDWSNATQPNPGFSSEQPISSGDIVRGVWGGSSFSFPAADDDANDFFYDGDLYGTSHLETSIGAVVQIPGRPYVITTTFDPNAAADTWQSGGLTWLDNSDGDAINGVRLYNGRPLGIDVGTFEKAAGIGDLEASCGVASIQIGNRVWFDADLDGTQDPGEQPLNGVTVELVNSSGTVVATTTTDAAGTYYFNDITADTDYKIRLAKVNYDNGGVFATGGTHAGKGILTTTDAGSADDLDSDAMLMDGLPSISVNVSATDHTFDFGMVAGVEVGNLVWFDLDNDGVRDSGEAAVPGVTVNLLDGTGTQLATEVTDGDGHYAFPNLNPGDYLVEIPSSMFASGAPLSGWYLSTGAGISANANDDVDDNSDGAEIGNAVRSSTVTVTSGPEPTAEVDESPNGTADGGSNLTVDFGFYTASLGNLLWFDDDNDGQKDTAETVVANAVLHLLDGSGAPVQDRSGNNRVTSTDANGNYSFTGLREGTYVVEIIAGNFTPGGALAGYGSSSGNNVNGSAPDPDDDTDSDDNGDQTSGGVVRSQPIVLAAVGEPNGSNNPTVDFGFVQAAGIGNYVWFDGDRDGVQDANEAAVSGITATVYRCGVNIEVGSAVTDAQGFWQVDGLSPGDYCVTFTDPQERGWTSRNQGDDAADSDAGTDGRTAVYSLDPGELDLTVDAGITPDGPATLAFTGPSALTVQLTFAGLSIMAGIALMVLSRKRNLSIGASEATSDLVTEID